MLAELHAARARFLSFCEVDGEHWHWVGQVHHKDGIGKFWLDGAQISARRAAWMLWKGRIPEGGRLYPVCGHKDCVAPICLRSGARSDVMQAALARGVQLGARGEANGFARLTERHVRLARRLKSLGWTYPAIAQHREFRALAPSESALSYAVNRVTWKGV